MRLFCFLLPLFAFSDFSSDIVFSEKPNQAPQSILFESMLYQANQISKTYALEMAKLSPPAKTPQPDPIIRKASCWFSIDLDELESTSFEALSFEPLWEMLKEVGVEGVYLKNLKAGGANRTGLGLDKKWGSDWEGFQCALQKKGLIVINDVIGNATGLSTDFLLALKNIGEYPSIYHLIEVEQKDWALLPSLSKPQWVANIPWLKLQNLQKKGYIPEEATPYSKQSAWNATTKVNCVDGKVRRWIYLKNGTLDPVIDFLNPSFSGYRIAAADVLESIHNLGSQAVFLDDRFDFSTTQMLSLWTRKLGGFSVLDGSMGICDLIKAPTDLIQDTLSPSALLHTALTQDAEALRLMYRILLGEKVEVKRLVHSLMPFKSYRCDWAELLASPNKRFPYYEEIMTGEALRNRLMKEDMLRLKSKDPVSWPSLCMAEAEAHELDQKYESAMNMHLLFAFFYAMQPGIFSFSTSDLLGSVTNEKVDLICPNANSIYGSLPSQMRNHVSFAKRLQNILRVRKSSEIEMGKLIAVPNTSHPGLLILIHELSPSKTQLLAVNFSKTKVHETLEIPRIRKTSAINLMTGLLEKKPLSSATYKLDLQPMSGKVILFQPKYYD